MPLRLGHGVPDIQAVFKDKESEGDQMVDFQFKSSSTDYNGAVKLAQAAATRL